MSRLFRTAAGTIFLLIGACGSGPPTEESDQAYDGAQDQLADATFEDVETRVIAPKIAAATTPVLNGPATRA